MASTSLSNLLVSWKAFSASSLVLVEAYEKNPGLVSRRSKNSGAPNCSIANGNTCHLCFHPFISLFDRSKSPTYKTSKTQQTKWWFQKDLSRRCPQGGPSHLPTL